jgi:hypothetical protein
MADWRRATRLVLVAYITLAAAPIVVSATHHSFWQHAHDMAPAAAALYGLLLLGLVRRHRWAWVGLLVLEIATLVSFAFDFGSALWLAAALARFALLVSVPMRRHVGIGTAVAVTARSPRSA